MNHSKPEEISRFEAFRRTLTSVFGVNEVLFLIGLSAFFYGASVLWSIAWALLIAGGILMAIAIGGILYSMRRGG